MNNDKDVEQDEIIDARMILFGYPITWIEKIPEMPVSDIVLADWSEWAEASYLRHKEAGEYEREGGK